jgi:hypothetical protein
MIVLCCCSGYARLVGLHLLRDDLFPGRLDCASVTTRIDKIDEVYSISKQRGNLEDTYEVRLPTHLGQGFSCL